MANIELSDVYRDEYEPSVDGQKLVCTDSVVRHVVDGPDGPDETTVDVDEITAVYRDVDRSLTGFRPLGLFYLLFALPFTAASIAFVASGAGVDVVTGGVTLSAALLWYGFASFYWQDQGTYEALEIRTDEGKYLFLTPQERNSFEGLATHLREVLDGR